MTEDADDRPDGSDPDRCLALIAEARRAHTDAGNDPFHVGAVTVCEELERVLRIAEAKANAGEGAT